MLALSPYQQQVKNAWGIGNGARPNGLGTADARPGQCLGVAWARPRSAAAAVDAAAAAAAPPPPPAAAAAAPPRPPIPPRLAAPPPDEALLNVPSEAANE